MMCVCVMVLQYTILVGIIFLCLVASAVILFVFKEWVCNLLYLIQLNSVITHFEDLSKRSVTSNVRYIQTRIWTAHQLQYMQSITKSSCIHFKDAHDYLLFYFLNYALPIYQYNHAAQTT